MTRSCPACGEEFITSDRYPDMVCLPCDDYLNAGPFHDTTEEHRGER